MSKTTDKKELKQAWEAIKEDGGFPHLQKAIEERLGSLDAAFKRMIDSGRISLEEEQTLAEDINAFIQDIHKIDKKLSKAQTGTEESGKNKNIFGQQSSSNDDSAKHKIA